MRVLFMKCANRKIEELIHSGNINSMSVYTDRVRDNIIPLSQASTVRESFKEWYFTDIHRDHENAVAEYQFTIF